MKTLITTILLIVAASNVKAQTVPISGTVSGSLTINQFPTLLSDPYICP